MTGLSQPKVGAGDDDDALLILDLPVVFRAAAIDLEKFRTKI